MDINEEFQNLHENLNRKFLEITKIIEDQKIAEEIKKSLNSDITKMQNSLITRLRKRFKLKNRGKGIKQKIDHYDDEEFKNNKAANGNRGVPIEDKPKKLNTRIDVLDMDGKKLNAFYVEKDFKPDKITIKPFENCKKVQLKITAGNFSESRTIHLPGDTKEDRIKFINTNEDKKIEITN